MAPKTDDHDIAGFYDRISGTYDVMTGFGQRAVRERPFIAMLVDRYKIARAVDAGTGTGFHALLLARLGVRVTAIDISPSMIAALKKHAAEEALQVAAVVGAFQDLPALIKHPQDALFSMGNTLAHAPTHEDLQATLAAFRQVLRPGGIIFIQMLNYTRILAAREKTLADKIENGIRFVRWYAYEGERVRFNITREPVDGTAPSDTQSVVLTPFTDDALRLAAHQAGFIDIRCRGSIALEPFDGERSRDAVILAHVPAD